MKLIEKIVFSLSVIFGLFLIGPEVKAPDLEKSLPILDDNLEALKDWIEDREAVIDNLKPNNASKLIYFDSVPKKTPFSVVYLHGFSASIEEGSPVHYNIANALRANLYLPRLAGHGLIEEEPLLSFTADKYLDSSREALAVAKIIGEKVIVISSSTGGTLSLILGSDPQIAALLLFGPNVEIFNPAAKLLTLPWGLQIARLYMGSKYHVMNNITEEKKNYWTTRYRLEPTVHLQKLVDVGMRSEIFKKVRAPVFMGYYYKNELEKDDVVSIPAMLKMFNELGTPRDKKQKMTFANSGDHVIISQLTTNHFKEAELEALKFLNNQLGIVPTKKEFIEN